MPVNKLQRFAEIKTFDHVFEHTDFQSEEAQKPRGRWNSDIFKNTNPIVLELACGKAAYTLALAQQNPEKNFIGIDIKGARIWKGCRQAQAEQLDNVRFLRAFIDHLDEYFDPGEVAEIWITFPDPYPRGRDRDKRLTSPRFLAIYKRILQSRAAIHFKTDDSSFFKYTLAMVNSCWGTVVDQVIDIYSERPEDELLTIQTDFEKKHLQNDKTISYCKFTLPAEPMVGSNL